MKVVPPLLLLPLAGCMMPMNFGGYDTGVGPTVGVGVDLDQDGFSSDAGDCDDLEPTVGPGFAELCDGLDNDCNLEVDQTGCDRSDRFEQHLAVDVLLVVDTSMSMTDTGRLGLTAEGATSMVQHLAGSGFDTQIGVVTMDMGSDEGGKLVTVAGWPGKRWLDGEQILDADAIARGQQWLYLAIASHEGTFYPPPAGRAAVESALLEHGVDGGFNDGFFRPEANVAVVFVSDTEDESLPTSPDLINLLAQQKAGRLSSVTAYAITQVDGTDCQGKPTTAANSVLDLVELTGGLSDSICRSDFNGFLTAVAQDIATRALGDTFDLTSPARLAGLQVSIEDDGHAYPWVGGYALSDPYTLVFSDVRPPAGVDIVVDYLIDYTVTE
ncbi:MAG: MopE-related protein [Myxococcota bacterium]